MRLAIRIVAVATCAILATGVAAPAAEAHAPGIRLPAAAGLNPPRAPLTRVATTNTMASTPSGAARAQPIPLLPGGNWHYVNWYYDLITCVATGYIYGLQGFPWNCQPLYVGPFIAAWWLYIWY